MATLTILTQEEREIEEECRQRREGWEARYGLPSTACPHGCDGSGWRSLEPGTVPLETEIHFGGVWLTPCACNVASCNRWGVLYRWPRRYPENYSGHKVGPPKRETA